MTQSTENAANTPFQTWMNAAVDQMQTAMEQAVWPSVPDDGMRPYIFKCFQALVKVMEEVIKAERNAD